MLVRVFGLLIKQGRGLEEMCGWMRFEDIESRLAKRFQAA